MLDWSRNWVKNVWELLTFFAKVMKFKNLLLGSILWDTKVQSFLPFLYDQIV